MCIQGRFSPHGTIPPSSAFHPSIGQHNVYSALATTACIVSASHSDENICVFDFIGWRGKRFSLSKPDEADIHIACTIILYQPIYRKYNISVCAPVYVSVCTSDVNQLPVCTIVYQCCEPVLCTSNIRTIDLKGFLLFLLN